MQYHHIYHAGNFADVFKHCTLILLVQTLLHKDKPFIFLDTHAGIGLYNLNSEEAQKNHEYQNGIAKLYNNSPFLKNTHANTKKTDSSIPPVIIDYLKIINFYNTNKNINNTKNFSNILNFYPGSPLFVRALMRASDRMLLAELHPKDIQELKKIFVSDKQTAVHHMDGYQSIKAFLPPKSGRGLILMDPAFEDQNEFEKIITALKIAEKRFINGIYAIWYPIKDNLPIEKFYRELKYLNFKNILIKEFMIQKTDPENTHLNKCGIIIINPPWKFEEQLTSVLSYLKDKLTLKEISSGSS